MDGGFDFTGVEAADRSDILELDRRIADYRQGSWSASPNERKGRRLGQKAMPENKKG